MTTVAQDAESGTDGSRALRTLVTGACLTTLVVVGLATFRHFGVGWDEPDVHRYGHLTLDYLTGNGTPDAWDAFAFYGPVIAVVQALIDRAVGSPVLGYQLGHLLVYALFVAAVVAFYDLCRRRFGWGWGVLGAAFLVVSPRVFSHAFVNSKDMPLMSLMLIAFYCLSRYIDSHRLWWLAASGGASALAIGVRVNAVAIVGLVGLALLIDLFGDRGTAHGSTRSAKASATYICTLIPLTVLSWPYLWSNPPRNLWLALRRMAHYVWGPPTVLYRGDVLPVDALPWHYIPWWILITVPLPYLALAALGLIGWPGRSAPTVAPWSDRLDWILYAAWLFGPFIYVIATGAVLYNEWRHMLFIYPPLAMFSVAGAVRIHRILKVVPVPRVQTAWVVVLLALIGWVSFRMAQLHPYQAIYFNSLAGGAAGAEGRYEMDYWGLSYKEGLHHLVREVDGPISVYACTQPGTYAELLMPEPDARRIVYSELTGSRYALCTPLEGERPYLPDRPTHYSVERDGGTLLYVKGMRPGD